MASETVVISWNVTNWITVLVIVAIGFLVIGAIAGMWTKWGGSANTTQQNPYTAAS